MRWSEAFRRSSRALGWLVLASIVCGLLMAIGTLLGAFAAFTQQGVRAGSIIAGWVFLLAGWLGLVFSVTAVMIKVFTEAVVEELAKHASPPAIEKKD